MRNALKRHNALLPHSKRVTQRSLAERLNISTNIMRAYLRGMKPLDLRVALIFEQETGISISAFSERLDREARDSSIKSAQAI